MQFADGTSPITYTVTGSITGRRVSMTSYTIKALVPEWTVTPDPLSSTNIRTGKITSTNSATSKMGVYYGERELGRSDDEIAFAKVDLKIYAGTYMSGFANISSSNNTLIVGEQINLKAVIDDTNLASQATYQWVLPNDAISYYDENAASNPVKRLDSNQLSSNAITFYLTASNSAAPITCNVTINGSQYALSNSLIVLKPTASLSAVNNAPVEVFYGKLYYNKDFYYLGFPPLKITPLGERPNPGMKFAGNRCTIPSGFTGTSCFTQVIDEAFTTINGKYVINSLDYKFGFEYHTESDKYLETAEDSPAQDLPNITSISIPSINAYHDFTMYIMFKPELPNSCYVPIQFVSWGWSGSANFNSTNSTWEAPSSQPTPWVSPVSTTADPPNWSSRTIGL